MALKPLQMVGFAGVQSSILRQEGWQHDAAVEKDARDVQRQHQPY
jgi:hypothetical protein